MTSPLDRLGAVRFGPLERPFDLDARLPDSAPMVDPILFVAGRARTEVSRLRLVLEDPLARLARAATVLSDPDGGTEVRAVAASRLEHALADLREILDDGSRVAEVTLAGIGRPFGVSASVASAVALKLWNGIDGARVEDETVAYLIVRLESGDRVEVARYEWRTP